MIDLRKWSSRLRIASIVCYCLICLQGSIIAVPFIGVLTLGLVDQEPTSRLFLLLADLGLIILAILYFRKRNKLTIAMKCIVYFMLLAPLVRLLLIFPLALFHWLLFWVPFIGFVILYPLSVLFSCLDLAAA